MVDSIKLSPKLEAVLAQLIKKRGPLKKTEAVKLPYLVDVVANRALGRSITGGTHQAWEHGVVTREVYIFITHGDPGDGVFAVEFHDHAEGGQQIDLIGDPPNILTEEEQSVVDFVFEEFGSLGGAELGRLTKSLNVQIPPEEWGSNENAALTEDAYARLSPDWQGLWQKLRFTDLADRSNWSEPVTDVAGYFNRVFDG